MTYARRRKPQAADPIANLFSQLGAALAGIWRVLGKSGTRLDRNKLLAQFGAIERLLAGGDGVHAAQAVMQADSFLDAIMREVGGQGASFADRLRSLDSRFSRDAYQSVWDAHKLRNQIAHEHPAVTVGQARAALASFRRAASQLGAF